MRSITQSHRLLNRIPVLLTAIVLSSIILVTVSVDNPGVTAQTDYLEYFYSVTPEYYDSDSDGYDDSVTLVLDVDTLGDYVDVTVYGDLDDPDGYLAASDSAVWSIYGEETEYGYIYLTVTSGNPGYYHYYLELYDDQAIWEEDWSGSVYLYPIGYGTTPTRTATPVPPPDSGGGLNGGVVAGIIAAVVLVVVVPGLFWVSKNMSKRRAASTGMRDTGAADARIRELWTQMERWRAAGYDVSELEDLFR